MINKECRVPSRRRVRKATHFEKKEAKNTIKDEGQNRSLQPRTYLAQVLEPLPKLAGIHRISRVLRGKNILASVLSFSGERQLIIGDYFEDPRFGGGVSHADEEERQPQRK